MSDGILSRWARRKQAVRAAERAPRPEAPIPAEVAAAAARPPGAETPESAEASDALAEAIARLPKLEDLTAETDLTPFLRAGIPSVLRNAALRRMWSVDPGIRDFVSEAREYAYDWNTPGGVPGLGPMLPTDDIKAMVDRIIGVRPPAPEPAVAGEESATAESTGHDPDLPPLAEVDVAPSVAPAPEAHVEAPVPSPALASADTFQSPAIVSRMRRHGGAMPS